MPRYSRSTSRGDFIFYADQKIVERQDDETTATQWCIYSSVHCSLLPSQTEVYEQWYTTFCTFTNHVVSVFSIIHGSKIYLTIKSEMLFLIVVMTLFSHSSSTSKIRVGPRPSLQSVILAYSFIMAHNSD